MLLIVNMNNMSLLKKTHKSNTNNTHLKRQYGLIMTLEIRVGTLLKPNKMVIAMKIVQEYITKKPVCS